MRRVIARAIADARSRGLDLLGQAEQAARELVGLDHNLALADARKLVEQLRPDA